MKIVHLNTYDLAGGAARSAYRLHKGLCRLGHDSFMFVSQARGNDPTVLTFQPPQDLMSRVCRRWRREKITRSYARYQKSRPPGYETFRDSRSPHGTDLLCQLPPCDIIHLHWVADFIDYRTFFPAVPRNTAVVWTLHDMNAFTGGCHYDFGCGRYVNYCGACPQLGSTDPTDLSYQVWQDKREALAQVETGRLYLVTPSRWLAQEVKCSALGRPFDVSVIPYGVDVENFAPRDRGAAREVLGIRREARVVLFLAEGIDNQRKGFSLLAQALSGFCHVENATLLSLGHGKPPMEAHIPWIHLGFVNNDRLLSLIYSAADLFIIPSLHDNLPNTVLEAMACGTPVIGFAVGGIPDMVRSGVTGMLVPPEDVAGLRAAISDLLLNPAQLKEMAINCRRIAREEYTLELQAERYAALYERILYTRGHARLGAIENVREGRERHGEAGA